MKNVKIPSMFFVLVFKDCYKKLPQTWWFKTRNSLIFLERPDVHNWSVNGFYSLRRLQKKNHSLFLLTSGDSRHNSVWGYITPISASVLTLPSALCVFVFLHFLSLMKTLVTGFRAYFISKMISIWGS